MARISTATIQDIVEHTDLLEVVSARVTLKKRGHQHWACCPFHQEKTASFSVNPTKQFFYCFGCGSKGNAIDFIMQHDRLDFVDTMQLLSETTGIALEHAAADSAQLAKTAGIYAVLHAASDYFQLHLRTHQLAIDYFKSRGISGKIAKHFQLGYVAAVSAADLCQALTQPKTQLIEGGLIKAAADDPQRYYCMFAKRVIFPIRDVRGREIGFGGRALSPQQMPKYINSPETAVFHKAHELYGLYEALQASRQLDYVVLVEGYMDVVALAQHGEWKAVASLGTAIGERHFQKLWRYTGHVVCCFDADKAGQQAAWKSLLCVLPLMQAARRVSFIHLPAGEDPDSFIGRFGLQRWQQLLQQAEPLSVFMFRYLQQQYSLEHLDDRAKFAHKSMQLLATVPHGLYKNMLLQELSQLTTIPREQLQDAERLQAMTAGNAASATALASRLALAGQASESQFSLLERCLGLLVQQPNLAHKVDSLSWVDGLQLPYKHLIKDIVLYCQQHEQASLGGMLACCQQDDKLKALLADVSFAYQDFSHQAREQEFLHVLQQLGVSRLQQKIAYLLQQAKLQKLSQAQKAELQQLIRQKSALSVGDIG